MPFQPGKSGNPGGRPKDKLGVRELAQSYCSDAVRVLKTIMSDGANPPNARVAAASVLLDRGLGRPEQHQTIEGALNVAYAISDKPLSPDEWNSQYADPTLEATENSSQSKH